jgi:hypothetical protein
MSKGKINPGASSKLSSFVAKRQQSEEGEIHGFITPNKFKRITKSFRLSTMDLEKLNKLVSGVNKESPYKNYSEAEVIRGLIQLCSKLSIKKVLSALQEIG